MKKNMKRCIYYSTAIFVYMAVIFPFSAQETGDTVVLPEVTTVISGQTITVTAEAIPDFSSALPSDTSETGVFPVLPTLSVITAEPDPDVQTPSPEETGRSVYIDGLAGFGLPAFFTGKFSVSRIDRADPFSIQFSYESMDGYAFNSFSDGFSDSTTLLAGSKIFSAGSSVWDLSGSYQITSTGLQGQSDLFSDLTRQNVKAAAFFKIPFAGHFGFESSVEAQWFNRYGGAIGLAARNVEKTAASFVSAIPSISVNWANDSIQAGLSGSWNFALYAGSGVRPVNRGELILSANWTLPSFSVSGRVGFVGIPGGSGADDTVFVVPFTLGIHGELAVPFSELPVAVQVAGGLDSMAIDFTVLEETNRFTCFAPELLSSNREQSDWFASLNVTVPVGNVFSVESAAEFRKTAYGNGTVQSDFDALRYPNSGLFYSSAVDRTGLATSLTLSSGIGNFLLSAVWNAEWLDIPAGKDAHIIECSAVYASSSGKWNTGISAAETVSSGADFVPNIGIHASYQVTDAVRLVFEVTDAVKLCTGKTRIYEKPFISRSGNASFSVRFFF